MSKGCDLSFENAFRSVITHGCTIDNTELSMIKGQLKHGSDALLIAASSGQVSIVKNVLELGDTISCRNITSAKHYRPPPPPASSTWSSTFLQHQKRRASIFQGPWNGRLGTGILQFCNVFLSVRRHMDLQAQTMSLSR